MTNLRPENFRTDVAPSKAINIPARAARARRPADHAYAAVGEAMGAGRTTGDFAYLYFAAGFGGGVIAGGVPMRGSHGNAGEFASTLPDGWPQPNLENLRLYLAAHGHPYDDLHAMLAGFDPATR